MKVQLASRRLISPACAAIGLFLGLAAPALIAPGAYLCAAHAAHDQQADEEKQGTDAVNEIAKTAKFCKDPAIVKRVRDIGARIAFIADNDQVPAGFGNDKVFNFKYDYTVIDSKEINAFSLPGGHIYIYTGLLDLLQTDDELAGVLGHETAHAAHHHVVTLEHQANLMSTQMALGVLVALLAKVPANEIGDLATGLQYADMAKLNNHFSEAAEQDADHTGMIYMQKAGFNPVGMLSMLQRLEDEEKRSPEIDLGYLQDHPLTPQRVAAAQDELGVLGVKVTTEQLRLVSGAISARVTDASGNTSPAAKLSIGHIPIALLAPANRPEAESAAAALNQLLDNNLRNDQVRAVGSQLFAGGRLLVTFTADDVRVQPLPAPTDALAAAAAKAVQYALWEITIEGMEAK